MFNKNSINRFYLYLTLLVVSRFIIFFILEIKPNFAAAGQLIDLEFLRNDLFESLYYLHFQPFLWNLYFGVISKFFSYDNTVYMTGFLLNILFTLFIIYYVSKILDEIKISKLVKNILILFIIFNPNIIFYEYYSPHYAQFSAMMMCQLFYFSLMYFKTRLIKFEIFAYSNLLILSFVWTLFTFIPLIFIFITFRVFEKRINIKSSLIFLIFIIISIIPSIKNKIVFNIFTPASWSGIQAALVLQDSKEISCSVANYQNFQSIDSDIESSKKIVEKENKLYAKIFDRNISNKYVNGPNSGNNTLGLIYRSNICMKWTVNKVLKDPYTYIKRVFDFLTSSHSKFAFEHDIKPSNWELNFNDNLELKKFKKIKQLLVLVYMASLYLFLLKNIILNNDKNDKFFFYVICFFNLYIVSVSHFMAGVETERMMHTLFFNHCIFIAYILGKLRFFNKRINSE